MKNYVLKIVLNRSHSHQQHVCREENRSNVTKHKKTNFKIRKYKV